jgi:hypothetical protein
MQLRDPTAENFETPEPLGHVAVRVLRDGEVDLRTSVVRHSLRIFVLARQFPRLTSNRAGVAGTGLD